MFKFLLLVFILTLTYSQVSVASVVVTKCVHVEISTGARAIYQVINGYGQCGPYSEPANGNKPAHSHATAGANPIWTPELEIEPTHPSCKVEANQTYYD